ncbi:molybdopterin converting factor subunit 1 [Sphingorhabdus sp.]|jgi:molybdopterin synthase sulfur carrier subunit|uniref:molybdopterin converting factor subunit 1 n=1 Tax=Sphingorhabdus sp. TaxID=1902408 RepID=UPI0037CA9ADC
MKLVYFASVREAIGLSSEDRNIPCDARTVGDFVIWLRGQSQEHAVALDDLSRLRFALDQNMVTADALLGDGEELAIFPPVTGG